jgi:hypothetical protein
MSTYAEAVTLRPVAERTDYRKPSRFREAGIAIALTGVALAVVALIANVVVADSSAADRAETTAWTFGLGATAFATVMTGIAAILTGILVRLWLRVESVKTGLSHLRPRAEGDGTEVGDVDTPYGPATVTRTAPEPLLIHRVAERMWAPMLAMGPMVVVAGLVLSVVQSGETNPETVTDLAAWVQGGQFLGLAMILGGISFLLGSILSSLRKGGAEVQEALGVTVKTLKMPASAKAFVALMAIGVMLAVAQFVLYGVAAGSSTPEEWFAWLGPVREASVGIILTGVVLALYTIGTVLGFQFDRLKQIVATGR